MRFRKILWFGTGTNNMLHRLRQQLYLCIYVYIIADRINNTFTWKRVKVYRFKIMCILEIPHASGHYGIVANTSEKYAFGDFCGQFHDLDRLHERTD